MPNKKVTATYNGTNIIDSIELQNSTIVYNGATIQNDFVGTRILKCANQTTSTNITIGNRTLVCAQKQMASDITVVSIGLVGNKPTSPAAVTYDTNSHNNGYTTPTGVTMIGSNSGIDAGNYTATYTPDTGYAWNDGTTSAVSITLTINPRSISGATVNLNTNSKIYNGSSQSVSVNSVVLSGYTPTYSVGGETSGTNVKTYTVTCTGTGNFTGSASAQWNITKLSLTIPSLSNTSKTYSGGSQSPTVNNFNGSWETQGGTASATNVNSYTVTWNLKDTSNTQWTDGSTSQKSGSWSIARASVGSKPSGQSYSYDGGTKTPYSNPYVSCISGTASASVGGSYSATYRVDGNHCWSDGTTSDVSISWTIQYVWNKYNAVDYYQCNQRAYQLQSSERHSYVRTQLGDGVVSGSAYAFNSTTGRFTITNVIQRTDMFDLDIYNGQYGIIIDSMSTDPVSYPGNSIVYFQTDSDYCYLNVSITDLECRGGYEEEFGTVTEFWPEYKGKQKSTYIGQVSNTSNIYPSDGIHTDGYWYTKKW